MTKSFAILAGTACLSLASTPAMAADIAAPAAPIHSAAPATAYDAEAENADRYRHRRYRRNRVRVGDVIAGAVIIGGIAAIANAASKSNRDRRYRERDRDYRYEDTRRDDNRRIGTQGRGMSGAVDMCVNQVERGEDRVGSVDNASRGADGWRVSGSLENGGGFNCWIDNQGRIRNVDFGESFSQSNYGASADYPVQDNQYGDDYYRSARADLSYGG